MDDADVIIANPTHPIWSLLRLVIILVAVLVGFWLVTKIKVNRHSWPIIKAVMLGGSGILILWWNATRFDQSEIMSLVEIFGVYLGAEKAEQVVRKHQEEDQSEINS